MCSAELARDLSSKDKTLEGDVALDEILFAGLAAGSSEIDSNATHSCPMHLRSINIDSKDDSEINLEVKFQGKYRELEQELCTLREVIKTMTYCYRGTSRKGFRKMCSS